MESVPQKLYQDEILALYEGRSEDSITPPPRENLNFHDRKRFETKFTKEVANYQRFLETDDEGAKEKIADAIYNSRKTKKIYCGTIDEAQSIELLIEKEFVDKKDEGKFTRLNVLLTRKPRDGEKVDIVGDFSVSFQGNKINIRHRFVDPKFRQQGFGDLMLKSIEKMVQEKANQEEVPQEVIMSSGQIDVYCWCWNKGYRIKSEETARFLRIIEGNQAFCLGKDLYVYKNDLKKEDRRWWENSERFDFVKPIEPNKHSTIVGNQEEISGTVKGLIG